MFQELYGCHKEFPGKTCFKRSMGVTEFPGKMCFKRSMGVTKSFQVKRVSRALWVSQRVSR